MPLSRNIHLLLFLCFLLTACYEKKEGCLDVLAKNFSLEADLNCCKDPDNCCCEYPSLTWRIKYLYGDENFSTGVTYQTKAGQPFQIEQLQFFVSNIVLIDDHAYGVDDSIAISGQDGRVVVKQDDVTIIKSNDFAPKFGKFTRPGQYMSLQFTIGLSEPELSADPDQFEASHPLAVDNNGLRDTLNNRWLLYDAAWIPDTVTGSVEHISLPASATYSISLPIDIQKDPGEDISILIGIDFSRCFEDIDILADDEAAKSEKILQGLLNSISIF